MKRILQKLGLGLAAFASILSVSMVAVPASASGDYSPYGCHTKVLKYNSYGTCVKLLQRMLNSANDAWRYSGEARLVVDGDFGPATDRKTIAYQKSVRLYPDGDVGKNTWTRLCADVKLVYLNRKDLKYAYDGYKAG